MGRSDHRTFFLFLAVFSPSVPLFSPAAEICSRIFQTSDLSHVTSPRDMIVTRGAPSRFRTRTGLSVASSIRRKALTIFLSSLAFGLLLERGRSVVSHFAFFFFHASHPGLCYVLYFSCCSSSTLPRHRRCTIQRPLWAAIIMARVYADINDHMPRSYWDYDSVNVSWGVLENYEVVRKIGKSRQLWHHKTQSAMILLT